MATLYEGLKTQVVEVDGRKFTIGHTQEKDPGVWVLPGDHPANATEDDFYWFTDPQPQIRDVAYFLEWVLMHAT